MLSDTMNSLAREEKPGTDTLTGTVKWFNNAKGWGFIKQDTGPDVFVHYSQIFGDGFRTLREGELVRFVLKDGPKGPLAESVYKVDEPVTA
jgi:CspA family cold shock protein